MMLVLFVNNLPKQEEKQKNLKKLCRKPELEQLRTNNEVLAWSLEFRTQHTARLLRRATKTGATEQQTSATLNASTSASTSTEGNAQQVTVKSEICDIDDLPGTNRTDSSTASAAQPTRNEAAAAGTVSRMSELLQRYPQNLVAKYIAFVGGNIGFMDSVRLEDLIGFLKATDPTNGELADSILVMCTDLCQRLAA
ncbi:hypothetical protein AAVH_15184 [Aphelenchoides avenae]|nr:hypothetical protein AAVH_15184 [Aphelenchus avenae]